MPHTTSSANYYYSYEAVKKNLVAKVSIMFGKYSRDMSKMIDKEIDLSMTRPTLKQANPPDAPDYSNATNMPTEKLKWDAKVEAYKCEQEQFNIDYQIAVAEFREREVAYENNKAKAFNLILQQYCSKVMQERVRQQEDFESNIKGNPIELLKVITILVNDPVRARYPFASLTEAFEKVINIQQQDNEVLLDYTDRFKEVRNMLKSIAGTEFLDKFVEHTQEYRAIDATTNQAARTELKNKAFQRWMTYVFVKKSDQKKYGSLLQQWSTMMSQKEDKYPKTLQEAVDVLAQHRETV